MNFDDLPNVTIDDLIEDIHEEREMQRDGALIGLGAFGAILGGTLFLEGVREMWRVFSARWDKRHPRG